MTRLTWPRQRIQGAALLAIAGIASAATLAACGNNDGVNPFTLTPQLPETPALTSRVLQVQLLDGASETVIAGVDGALFTVIGGTGKVLPVPDQPASAINADDVDYPAGFGIATVQLAEGASFDNDQIRYRVQVPGYVASSGTLDLDDGNELSVRLASLSTPPAGVKVNDQVVTLAGATSPITIDVINPSVANPAVQDNRVTLTLPAGIGLRDRNGNPVTANSVRVETTVYSSQQTESLLSFPGGLSVVIENADNPAVAAGGVGADGATIFESAGFVAIDMFVGDTEIKSFDQPITVRFAVNPATIDPATGLPVVVGAVIPVWSLDNDSGQWRYEGDGEVRQEPGQTELFVEFETSHLTYFNLDYFGFASCSRAGIELVDSSSQLIRQPLGFRLRASDRGYALAGTTTAGVAGVANFRGDLQFALEVYNPQNGAPINITTYAPGSAPAATLSGGKLSGVRLCSNAGTPHTGMRATLDTSSLPVPQTVSVKVETVCQNAPYIRQPVITDAYVCGGSCPHARTDATGTATFQVFPGQYTVYAYDSLLRQYVTRPLGIATGQTVAPVTMELLRTCPLAAPSPTPTVPPTPTTQPTPIPTQPTGATGGTGGSDGGASP